MAKLGPMTEADLADLIADGSEGNNEGSCTEGVPAVRVGDFNLVPGEAVERLLVDLDDPNELGEQEAT